MSGQAESPTKALLPNDYLQKSITDLSAQVNTLQANLNQMSGPTLPTLDNNGPISKEPLADDQWKLTMHQILTELCAKVNNLESELRDLKSQTCAPLNEGTPYTFRFGFTSPPAPPAKRPRPQAPISSSEPPSYRSKVGNPTKPTPQKTPIPPTSQPLLQPPVPAHLLTKVMGRPMADKTLHEMDESLRYGSSFGQFFPTASPHPNQYLKNTGTPNRSSIATTFFGANTQPEHAQPGRPHVPTVFLAQPQPSTTDSSTTENDTEMADINKDQGPVVLTEDEQC
ncbi:hypothetical protein SARC_03952 [Sphaeroforma arctica JP610]|uniref:Uncharacterized protein n=1 Tax=Sphaeroforma arctica JP610 TaxID=667725 RepID=A0A0L0G6G5_9EUKA|nr:hypothetical protein SARC_03952 [Sphaeroforma arctica JP610]KNC83823.1 hypothetical protein SARC_03952 [Sphaeroforma arctica JP610]|eukprot:XP_014157725.1 hypothetical protein SARC_03952 [Sphaeroforma arctica JP610]